MPNLERAADREHLAGALTLGGIDGEHGDVLMVAGGPDLLAAQVLAPVLSLAVFGVAGPRLGAGFVRSRAERLTDRRVFIVFSNDEIGSSGAAETAEALRAVGAHPLIAPCPDGVHDLAAVLSQHGPASADVVRKMIFAANRAALEKEHRLCELCKSEVASDTSGQPHRVLADCISRLAGRLEAVERATVESRMVTCQEINEAPRRRHHD